MSGSTWKIFLEFTNTNDKPHGLVWLLWRKRVNFSWPDGSPIVLERIGNSLSTFTGPVKRFDSVGRTGRLSRYSRQFQFQASCPSDGHQEGHSESGFFGFRLILTDRFLGNAGVHPPVLDERHYPPPLKRRRDPGDEVQAEVRRVIMLTLKVSCRSCTAAGLGRCRNQFPPICRSRQGCGETRLLDALFWAWYDWLCRCNRLSNTMLSTPGWAR